MKKKINTIDLISLGLPIFAAIGIILRSIAFLTAFDSSVGYFSDSTVITYLDRAFFAIAILFGIAVSILIKKNEISIEVSPTNLWSTFASLILGFVFAIFGLLFLLMTISSATVLTYVVYAGAFISAVYYLYEGFRPIRVGTLSAARALVVIISIIGLIAIVFVENFDFYVALNNSEKTFAMFIFVIASIFTIQKLKFVAGNPSPRFYLCTSYITAFLGAYFSIPGIIANCAGIVDSPKYLLYYLLALGLAIYASIDFIGRIKLSKLAEIPTVPTEQ